MKKFTTRMDPKDMEIRIACVDAVFSKHVLRADPSDGRVMGATGSGKTTFINRASGSDFPVESGLESCTTDVGTSKPFLLDGRFVTLIDTPGFDDTVRNDTDVLTSIAAYLSNTYEQGAKLAGILYMHRISDVRMSGTSKRNFRIFRELCGESTLSNVLIVTNMWGNVDSKIGEERERELATSDKLFKPVLEKGARLLRHDNTEASAHAILRNLISGQTATLAIQHEIVNQRKDLAQTAAGSELTRLLKEQAQRYDDEITELHGELELATRVKDEARKELQEEVERKRQEIERIQRDVGRMATDFLAERSRLESRIVEMEAENRRYLANLKDLQDQVNNARKEAESMQMEHARRESELLAMRGEEAENKARLPEEERRAREQVEVQYREEVGRVQPKRPSIEIGRAPEKMRIEHSKADANATGRLEPRTASEGDDEDTRNFAEDIAFLVDFTAKTFLPRPLETRLKSLMAQAARVARESTISGHKFISTYLSR